MQLRRQLLVAERRVAVRRMLASILVLTAFAAGFTARSAPAVALPAKPARAIVRIVVFAPKGVPANVFVRRVGSASAPLVAAKAPTGSRATAILRLSPGRYRVVPQTSTAGGVRYAGSPARTVVLRPGGRAAVTVRFVPEAGASRLATGSVTATSVTMRWRAPDGAKIAVRRSTGLVPPATVRSGTAVRAGSGIAIDRRVRAGTDYAYSVFTRVGGRWLGPLTTRLRTPAASRRGDSYVAAPGTAFLTGPQVRSVRASGSGVAVALAADAPRPVVGAAMIVPPGAGLTGGFIGRVVGFAPDGSALLAPGGLGDALTKYDLSSDAFTSDPASLPLDRVRATLAGRATEIRPLDAPARSLFSIARAGAAPSPFTCKSSHTDPGDIVLQPDLRMGGKYRFTGDMTTLSAHVEAETFVEGQASMSIELKEKAVCSLKLPSVSTTVMAGPVPIAFQVDPVVSATVSGSVHAQGLGFTVRAGFSTTNDFRLTPQGLQNGGRTGPIAEVHELHPSVSARTDVEVRLGGDLEIGPGFSNSVAGLSAGIHGELDLFKGTIGVAASASALGTSMCVRMQAGMRAVLGLYARAFLKFGIFEQDAKATLDLPALDVPFGEPITAPKGCSLDAATTGIPVSSGGDGGGTGGTTTAPPVVTPTRPLGDGATTALPADAGDQVLWRTLSGHVSSDLTLGSDAPHSGWILDHVIVDPGVTLTVAAGTRLRIRDRYDWLGYITPSVQVDGTVELQGTDADPVLVSSLNDTGVGGTTGFENPNVAQNGRGGAYRGFLVNDSGVLRMNHVYARQTDQLVQGGGEVDILASGFGSGTRLTGVGSGHLTLTDVQASGLTVQGWHTAWIEDAALADSSVELQQGRLQDVALAGASHLQVLGADVHLVRTSVAASALPIGAAVTAIAADFSGVTSPDGIPWLLADGGSMPFDQSVTTAMPVAFASTVTVPAGVTWTLPHGARLAFPAIVNIYDGSEPSLVVAGRLQTSGTGAAPVLTGRPDTSFGADMSVAGRLHDWGWGGMKVASGGTVELTDADLRGRIWVWAGGQLALHGHVATTAAGGTVVAVATNGSATLSGVTGSALTLQGAPITSPTTAGSDGDGRITVVDSDLTDSSVALLTVDSSIDRTALRGGSTLTATRMSVNQVGHVSFADGAPDEVGLIADSNGMPPIDVHWSETTVPIRVSTMVSMGTGASLTVDPGVTLRLGPCGWGYGYAGNSCFRLTGGATLRMLGTATSPVRLSPQLSTGDPNQTLPWFGIDAEDTSTVELRHVRTSVAREILRTTGSAAATIEDLQHGQHAGAPLVVAGSSTPIAVTDSSGLW